MAPQATDPSAFAECHEHALTFPMGGRCPECAVLQAQHERDCAVEDLKRLQIALTDLLRHCDMQPAGETRFERAVISARKALHPDVPVLPEGCHRSHPHEDMNAECERLTEIARSGAIDAKPCTCHPDDNPPRPCPRKYALTECRRAADTRTPDYA